MARTIVFDDSTLPTHFEAGLAGLVELRQMLEAPRSNQNPEHDEGIVAEVEDVAGNYGAALGARVCEYHSDQHQQPHLGPVVSQLRGVKQTKNCPGE